MIHTQVSMEKGSLAAMGMNAHPPRRRRNLDPSIHPCPLGLQRKGEKAPRGLTQNANMVQRGRYKDHSFFSSAADGVVDATNIMPYLRRGSMENGN